MDTAHSQHLSRLSKMLLAGIGVAFAWALLSVAFGLSSSQAHADDDGLLGGLTSAVDMTTSAVTDVVGVAATTAVEVVEPIVNTPVVPVAPIIESVVAPIVAPVVSAPALPVTPIIESVVAPIVRPVVVPITELPLKGVVAPIVDTALGVVDTVPLVSEAASALGVDAAASALGNTVDGALQATTTTVTGTVTEVIDTAAGGLVLPSTPTLPLPGVPALPATDSVPLVEGAVTLTSAVAGPSGPANPFALPTRTGYSSGSESAPPAISVATPAPASAPDIATITGVATAGLLTLLRAAIQADSVLVGPSGAGPGAWMLVAFGLVVAHRAWVRRSGPEDDVVPAAPTFCTDVSPD